MKFKLKLKFNLKKLISYYKPYKITLFFDLFFSLNVEVIAVAIPLILRYITNQVIFYGYSTAMRNIFILSVVILILLAAKYCCAYYTLYYGHVMAASIENDMRTELFEHFQKLSHKFYDNKKVGELMSRITTDLANISDFMHHFPVELTSILTSFVGIFTVFLIINWKLALLTTWIVPLIGAYIIWFLPNLSKAFEKNLDMIGNVNSQIEDSLTGIRVVKSFANEKGEIKKFKNENKNFVDSQKKSFRVMGWGFSGMWSMVSFYAPFLVVTGSVLILHNNLPIADLMTFILYQFILIGPLFGFMNLIEMMSRSLAGYSRFIEILGVQPDIVDNQNAFELKNIEGSVSIRNVTFKYENMKKNILENFSLDIKSGEYVALVGSSGVGKSTIFSLIPRFYDVSKGEILVDGINIKNIKLESLRQNIGFVQQDTFLFSGSILENIQYGKPGATEEEIILAAKNAYSHDFITDLPDGYETYVGPRGLRLSGGQKQRIAIARAFLKNPPILIFDEATSSLDNESERYIQKSMEKLAENRTTIVIAHRLSTIKNAKRILVMAGGKIVEEGTHDELITKNGAYAEFYNLL